MHQRRGLPAALAGHLDPSRLPCRGGRAAENLVPLHLMDFFMV